MEREKVRKKYLLNKKYQSSSDEINNRYSLANKFGFYFEYRKFAETIKLLKKCKIVLGEKNVLDIGCHRGYQLNQLAFLKGSSKSLHGIDFIDSFIKKAKEINAGIDFKVMDFYDLKFKNGSFDFITLYYVINCMPIKDRAKIIEGISRKVKKGGHVLVFEHSDNPIINSIRKIVKAIKREDLSYKEYANNLLLLEYFKDFKIVKSKRMINFFSSVMCKFLPYPIVELFDYLLPNNYYIVLLEKTR